MQIVSCQARHPESERSIMTFEEFRHVIRTLHSIDQAGFVKATGTPTEFGPFCYDPVRWILKSSDERAMPLFRIIEARNLAKG
jgi:hypothetical protein